MSTEGFDSGHGGCRISEFARWPRIALEHEREHLSRAMAARAFRKQDDTAGLMHDLSDIDACLQQLPKRVET